MAKLTINPDFNTSVPNYVYDPKLWANGNGGKGLSVYYPLIYGVLIDKVTETYDAEDGTRVGVVLGGVPVSLSDISDVLGCSYQIAQRATAYLVEKNLIGRQLVSLSDGYRYFIINCRKEFKDKDVITYQGKKFRRVEPDNTPDELAPFSEEIEFLNEATPSFDIEDEDDEPAPTPIPTGWMRVGDKFQCSYCRLMFSSVDINHQRSRHPKTLPQEFDEKDLV